MSLLVKKWIWSGVWALPGPPGQAKPVPVRATARGRSEASWEPWNHPIPPKKNLLTKTIYGLKLLLLKIFCRTPPSRGYSSDFSDFYKFLLRDPLVGWVAQKNFSNKSFSPYMILVSIIFFKVIGYLEGAQEAPDLPQAVAPTGTDCAQPRGSERVKTPHHMDFYTKWHMSNSVKFWNQSLGVILNHSTVCASVTLSSSLSASMF